MRIANDIPKVVALFVILTIALVVGRISAQDSAKSEAAKDAAKVSEPPPRESAESYAKIRVEVELRGTLHYAAAGSTVTALWRTYELYHDDKELRGPAPEPWKLDFRRAKKLQGTIKALDGKEVVLTGQSELRMVMQRLPMGGSGGFGGQNWPPSPTWSVDHSVLVSGVRLADEK